LLLEPVPTGVLARIETEPGRLTRWFEGALEKQLRS
jgi:hypothetical protein